MSESMKSTTWKSYYQVTEENRIKEGERPVFIMSSVKGGSGKTYSSISIALTMARLCETRERIKRDEAEASNNTDQDSESEEDSADENPVVHDERQKARVCLIDLDLTGTNMNSLLSTAGKWLAKCNGGDEDKMSIGMSHYDLHSYMNVWPANTLGLEEVVSSVTYAAIEPDTEKTTIDVIFGAEDSNLRRLFQRTADNHYQERIRLNDVQVLLYRLLDQVMEMQYDTVVIDMQPGMDGIAESVFNYFENRQGNDKKQIHGAELNSVMENVKPVLVLCSTTEMTQLKANVEWWAKNQQMHSGIDKAHLILKDSLVNRTAHEPKPKKGIKTINAENVYTKTVKTLINDALKDLLPIKLRSSNRERETNDYFGSLCVLDNNKVYVQAFLEDELEKRIPAQYPYRLPDLFTDNPLDSKGDSLEGWLQDCILEWKVK